MVCTPISHIPTFPLVLKKSAWYKWNSSKNTVESIVSEQLGNAASAVHESSESLISFDDLKFIRNYNGC